MLKKLKNKKIAIVSMGRSQLDYHMSISHSQEYDEVWAINSMCAVIKCDRVFMMDPASRFFDTFDAGPQTQVMCRTLPKLEIPIYSCEKDNRVPAIELYPLKDLGIDVSVAASSSMLDTNVPEEQKLYGYHRLENPPVVYLNKGQLDVTESSEIKKEDVHKGFSGRTEQITIGPPEPEAY